MKYVQIKPQGILSTVIDHFWLVEGKMEYSREKILPYNSIDIMLNLGAPYRIVETDLIKMPYKLKAGWISGMRTSPIIHESVSDSICLVGAQVKPGKIGSIFHIDASELTGRVLEISDILGNSVDNLQNQIYEASSDTQKLELFELFLSSRLKNCSTNTSLVDNAVSYISLNNPLHLSIKDLSESMSISQKQLQRLFKQKVGILPYEYYRIARFQRLISLIEKNHTNNWALTALTGGYYDQPHMIKEFKEISGLTPQEYLLQMRDYGNFIPVPVSASTY